MARQNLGKARQIFLTSDLNSMKHKRDEHLDNLLELFPETEELLWMYIFSRPETHY